MTALVVLLNTRNTPLVHAVIASLPLVKRARRRVEVSPPRKGYAESISGIRRDGYRPDGTFFGPFRYPSCRTNSLHLLQGAVVVPIGLIIP
jgi:hypothetical protein